VSNETQKTFELAAQICDNEQSSTGRHLAGKIRELAREQLESGGAPESSTAAQGATLQRVKDALTDSTVSHLAVRMQNALRIIDAADAPTPVADSVASDAIELLRKFMEYRDSDYVPNVLFDCARTVIDLAAAKPVSDSGVDFDPFKLPKRVGTPGQQMAELNQLWNSLPNGFRGQVNAAAKPVSDSGCSILKVLPHHSIHFVGAVTIFGDPAHVLSARAAIEAAAKPVSVDAGGLTLQQAALAHATEHGAAACVIPIVGTELVVAVGTRENLVQLLTPPTESTGVQNHG